MTDLLPGPRGGRNAVGATTSRMSRPHHHGHERSSAPLWRVDRLRSGEPLACFGVRGMSRTAPTRPGPGLPSWRHVSTWNLWRTPRSVIILVLTADLVSVVAASAALATTRIAASPFIRLL